MGSLQNDTYANQLGQLQKYMNQAAQAQQTAGYINFGPATTYQPYAISWGSGSIIQPVETPQMKAKRLCDELNSGAKSFDEQAHA